ncbi:hypothetical protein HPB51_015443 [Rhipicephalus microplus]|uniref:Uncharacterized protein n=1 Tax=Rhipicephalus microplus TaxID=6941 RepID=A0A9J6DVR5_RHIMP|nr:hypothetical protein HPB51_015443 [Rhipicephalus microplus]
MEILVTPAEDAPMVVTSAQEAACTTNEPDLKDELRLSSESSRASPSFPIVCGNAGYVTVRPSIFLDMHVPMEVSTSVVLSFCQRNVLRHYYRLLAVVGWRPLVDTSEHVRCQPVLQTLNVMHNIVVFVVLVLGHVLQYTACFRRDGIISYRSQAVGSANNEFVHAKGMTCGSSSFAVYVLPANDADGSVRHRPDAHALPRELSSSSLSVEKVFLQLTPTDVWNCRKETHHATSARRLRRRHPLDRSEDDQEAHYFLLGALVAMLLFRDVVSMTLATSYAIHCQLLLVYLQNISQAVRERRITFWSSSAASRKRARASATSTGDRPSQVTVQTIWVTSRMVVCFYALMGTPWTHWIRFLAAWLNVFVWLSLVLIPLVQASRLSSTCRHVRELGPELTARPFVYRDVPQSELDSVPPLHDFAEDAGEALRPADHETHGYIRVPVHSNQLVHMRAAGHRSFQALTLIALGRR